MEKTVIVMVDDDTTLGGMIKVYFETSSLLNYEVVVYKGADYALSKKEKWAKKAKVIITDLQMPGMRGDEFTAKAKKHCPEIKIIMISGIGERLLSLVAEASGADAFLEKPFKLEQLQKAVQKLLS